MRSRSSAAASRSATARTNVRSLIRWGRNICDLVITNAVIIDHWGIVKGDIGIRGGRIVAVGKSGNPLTRPWIDPRLVIGPGTEIIAGEGRIVTAGGIDTHIHFICPQQIETAIASGSRL